MFNSKYAKGQPRTSGHDLPVLGDGAFERSTPKERRYEGVPKLMVAWDTETTGFHDYKADEESSPGAGDAGRSAKGRPISYGLVVYRNGIEQPHENQHFLVLNDKKESPMSEGAYKTHLISHAQLEASHAGKITADYTGNPLEPALHPSVAVSRFLQTLAHYQKQGAKFLGHNLDFDYKMLEEAHKGEHDGLSPTQFDFEGARKNTIDTMLHARVRGDLGFDQSKGRMSDSLTGCSNLYEIKPGGHTAVDDARAAAQVFFNQVANNIGIQTGAEINRPCPTCGTMNSRKDNPKHPFCNRICEAHAVINNNDSKCPVCQKPTPFDADTYHPAWWPFCSPGHDRLGRSKEASKGQSGVDYARIMPFCEGEHCPSCLHIAEADAANRDESGKAINKRHEMIIKNVKILHEDVDGLKKGK